MNANPTSIIGVFVRHANAANLVMGLMLVIGVYAAINLTTRFWPPTHLSTIDVAIAWPGASAEDVSDNVLDAVEAAVRFLPGVDTVRSFAQENSARSIIEFEPQTDMQSALGDVEQAIAAITTLPEESEAPRIVAREVRDPVAKIGVSGPFSEAALQIFARTIRDGLLDRGLDEVDMRAVRDQEIIIDAREHDLLRHGLSTTELASIIRANTADRPSGTLDGVIDQQVRVLAGEETPEVIGAIKIKALPTGESLLVGDIADVYEGFSRGAVTGLRNGEPAIELVISRAQSADALEADAVVRAYVDEVRASMPDSLTVSLYDVRTERLWDRIGILVRNGWQGLAIVLVVLFIFLDARVAFWVAVGIPAAFAATLGVMLVSGQTINMVSLFGLIMMLGVIVDDAIVVGEHADTLASRGVPLDEAAERGAREMLVPVLASSITTIAAFGPIFIMRDIIGQMMSAIPLVAISIIVASLIECFLVLPGHLAHAWRPAKGLRIGRLIRLTLVAGVGAIVLGAALNGALWLLEAIGKGERTGLDGLNTALSTLAAPPPVAVAIVAILAGLLIAGLYERSLAEGAAQKRLPFWQRFRKGFDRRFNGFRDGPFPRIVRATYNYRYTTLAVGIGSAMVVIYGLYVGGGHVRFVFFPSPEAEYVSARVSFHAGTPRSVVIAGVREVETTLRDVERRLAPEGESLVRDAYSLIGRAGRERGDNLATLAVQLAPSEVRTVRTPEIVRAWRDALPAIAGVKRVSVAERRGGPPGRDIDIKLSGAAPAVLKMAATEIMSTLDSVDGVTGVTDDLPYGKPEVAIRLTPRGAALGFTLEAVGAQVRGALEGEIARRLAVGDEELILRVRQRDGGKAINLEDLFLQAPTGVFVPLTEVVEMTERNAFSLVQRRDGKVTVSIFADVDSAIITPQEVADGISETVLPAVAAKYNVDYALDGKERERQRSIEDLQQGTMLAAIIIYITLAFVFGCYWRPIVIMLIVPFGAIGAIIGHVLLGMNVTIVSLAGMLGLAGILVNDSIILVRRFDERMAAGEAFGDAAVAAASDRLRAVLLTSLTTIGGLIPLIFETSLSAQFLIPMAITIVFGLSLATLLVLILVPTLLGICRDIGRAAALLVGRHGDAPA